MTRHFYDGYEVGLATKSPSRMTENIFYFTLKAYFFLEMFKFLC